jgi:hypothetical protein
LHDDFNCPELRSLIEALQTYRGALSAANFHRVGLPSPTTIPAVADLGTIRTRSGKLRVSLLEARHGTELNPAPLAAVRERQEVSMAQKANLTLVDDKYESDRLEAERRDREPGDVCAIGSRFDRYFPIIRPGANR